MNENARIPIDLLEKALRSGQGCGTPERIAAAVAGELEETEAAELLAHAESCAACAAELELARGFFAATTSGAEVDEVLRRLPGRLESARATAKVLPMRRPSRPTAPRSVVWAAAASVLLAVALGLVALRPSGPAPLPDRPIEDVVRGGRIEITSSLGVRASAPESIAWSAVAGATRYRVEILGVDGEPVAAAEVVLPEWSLPESARSALETFVAYRVRVAALDTAGGELAVSPATELRLEPAP